VPHPTVDTVAAILPRGGATATTKVAEAEGMVPSIIIAIVGHGHGDRRRGSASTVSTTTRMTTIAEDIPNLLVIDETTSTRHTDLNHLEVPPPREIRMGSMTTTRRRDVNSAMEIILTLNNMQVQLGKRQVS
jgi:hypothetical protein